MGGTKDAGGDARRAVSVVEGDLRESAWQRLDLPATLAALPVAPSSGPASLTASATGTVRTFRQTGSALLDVLEGGRAKSVPAGAFVSVGHRGGTVRRRAAVSPPRSANDNRAAQPGRKGVWRDVFFLAVLAATVLGAFWSGRVHGLQKVIVVPGPSSFHSVVT